MSKQSSTAMRTIDEPHYSYWQALYHSFFNEKLYVDVGKRWRGFSFTYLFLLMCVVSLPISVRLILMFNDFYQQQLILPIKKLPPFMVQAGKVFLDKPMPYFIKNEAGEAISIIDTSGTITNIDNRYPKLAILVTKDRLIFRSPSPPQFFKNAPQSEPSMGEQRFPIEMNQIFDGSVWIDSSGIKGLKVLAEIMIYPTFVLLFFTIFLVFIVTFSLMAQLVASILLKFSLTYGQAFRLLIVSATPFIVVLVAAMTLNWLFMGMGYVLIILLAAYFSFAVLALKRASKKLVFA